MGYFCIIYFTDSTKMRKSEMLHTFLTSFGPRIASNKSLSHFNVSMSVFYLKMTSFVHLWLYLRIEYLNCHKIHGIFGGRLNPTQQFS